FKQKTAYHIHSGLEFRRVLFRSHRRGAAEGRPLRVRDRAPAENRVGRLPIAVRVERFRLARTAAGERGTRAAVVRVRGPPRVVRSEERRVGKDGSWGWRRAQ